MTTVQVLQHAVKLNKLLEKLAAIADAFDANELDDEARKFWGAQDEHQNERSPDQIILYTGRGGKTLLTLHDCLQARELHTAISE